MTEKIKAAAIKFDDVVWSVPSPGRHHDVIAYILRERPWYERVGGTQGFVTSQGRFVEREEARKIAECADQLIKSDKDDAGIPIVRQHRELFDEVIVFFRIKLAKAAAEIERLTAQNREARDWLAQCLGYVTGEGPPSWDGIRAFLKLAANADQQTAEKKP